MKTRIRLLPLLALAFLSTPGQAAEPAECYSLEKGSSDFDIGMMTIDRDGAINFATVNNPYAAYRDSCDFPSDGPTQCQLDCDGGRIHLMMAGDGLLVTFSHRRIESIRMESVTTHAGIGEADGVILDGRFYLEPAPKTACEASENLAQPLHLEPGDLYPAVKRLESYLLVGGYFADAPDWYYTAETAEAVEAFQREVGLQPTGTTDRDLLKRIGIHATYAFGGC